MGNMEEMETEFAFEMISWNSLILIRQRDPRKFNIPMVVIGFKYVGEILPQSMVCIIWYMREGRFDPQSFGCNLSCIPQREVLFLKLLGATDVWSRRLQCLDCYFVPQTKRVINTTSKFEDMVVYKRVALIRPVKRKTQIEMGNVELAS